MKVTPSHRPRLRRRFADRLAIAEYKHPHRFARIYRWDRLLHPLVGEKVGRHAFANEILARRDARGHAASTEPRGNLGASSIGLSLRSAAPKLKRAAPPSMRRSVGHAPGLEMPVITLVPLDTVDSMAVETLLDRAFGPDRFTRTAYAIRGASTAISALSFAAIEHDRLIGSIQCWPIVLAEEDRHIPLVMMGPVAVEPSHQSEGIGRRLMTRALGAAAIARLDDALMLIGDPGYYGRFFGFTADRTGAWQAPGPVERHRLLARGVAVPDAAGMLGPLTHAAAY